MVLLCAAADIWLIGSRNGLFHVPSGPPEETDKLYSEEDDEILAEEDDSAAQDPTEEESSVSQRTTEEGENAAAQEPVMAEEPEVREELLRPGELGNPYYYSLLTEEEQRAYREILQGLRDREDAITLDCWDGENAGMIYLEVLYDWPDLFWCENQIQYTLYYDLRGKEDHLKLCPDYLCSEGELAAMQAEIEAAAAACLSGIPADASDYEKVRCVYEYVINGMEYDKTEYEYVVTHGMQGDLDSYSIYGALVKGTGVCEAYCRGIQYLLTQLGIPCIFVVGTVSDGGSAGNHAWNMVQCGGAWYEVDATWGDGDSIEYGYLCCSSATLDVTHTESPDYTYPDCVSEDLDWYRRNGLYYETFDAEEALDVMCRDIDAGSESSTFRYGSEEVCQAALDSFEESLLSQANSYLAETYGLQWVACRYQLDPFLNRITAFWSYD